MATRLSDLEHREDQRRKRALYDSPASQKHRDERDRKTDASDALRRRHADEKAELNHAIEAPARTGGSG